MTTALDKTLKRALLIGGRQFVLAVSPDGLKLTPKGKRTGIELSWSDLVSGDAALAVALNASLGRLAEPVAAADAAPRAPVDRPKARVKRAARATRRKK